MSKIVNLECNSVWVNKELGYAKSKAAVSKYNKNIKNFV